MSKVYILWYRPFKGGDQICAIYKYKSAANRAEKKLARDIDDYDEGKYLAEEFLLEEGK